MTRATDRSFVRARLQLARSLSGLTQSELADRVAVTQQFIGYLETGRKQPSELLAEALGDVLGVEADFFYEPFTDAFRVEEWSFRKFQTTPAGVVHRLSAHGALFADLVGYLDRVLHLPPDSVPVVEDIQTKEEIELAAERCRATWGLGLDTPLKNLTRTLERAGVAVATIAGGGEKVDAFSRSTGNRSVIVINDDKQFPARRVFNLAHELGHLVMHVGQETGTHETEDQANAFASAFLLPRAGFVKEFPRASSFRWSTAYWGLLFDMKKRWRVSVSAIVRRAFELRLIDAIHYQRAYKYLSFKGWLRGEPAATEPDLEQPEMLNTALALLESRLGLAPADLAHELHWKPRTLEHISGTKVGLEKTGIVSLSARRRTPPR